MQVILRFTSDDLGKVRHRFLNLCEEVFRTAQSTDGVKCPPSALAAVDAGGSEFRMVVTKRMWGSLTQEIKKLVHGAGLTDVVWVGQV